MTKGSLLRRFPRVKEYFRKNWGAPSIIGLMLLLIVAAASLSIGLANLTDEVAISIYYALVVGVVLQLVCFLKYNNRSSQRDL